MKTIIEAAILCVEQEFTLRGHRDHAKSASDDDCHNMKKVHQGNFLAIVNTFAKFDTILKENIEQGFRNAEFLSWDIQNDIISCKGAYFRINVLCNTDEVTERQSNKKVFLICLRCLRYINGHHEYMKLSLILRIIRDDLQVKLFGKPFENNDINVADCTALAHDGAKVMGSEISRAAIFIKKQPLAQYTHDINQS